MKNKKSQRIYLYWFVYPNGTRNFGDELGPYIIRKLSGIEIKYTQANDINYKNFIRRFSNLIYRSLKEKKLRKSELKAYLISWFFVRNYIISIGSIIQHAATRKSIVWGSGISNPDDLIKEADFKAVRGPLTLLQLKKSGIETKNIALGDPALLLPVIYIPKIKKKYRLGIIAHVAHEKYVREFCTNPDILIISMLGSECEDIIDRINQCEYTISSSLHGVIVSHAYNIPCLWYKFPGDIGGRLFVKFSDYFGSVGIEDYKGYEVKPKELNNSNNIISNINQEPGKKLPKADLLMIQYNLLAAAPFNVQKKYLKIY
jgi:hypothetical protein